MVTSGWRGSGLKSGEDALDREGCCCCCVTNESMAVGDGVGICFAESTDSGRVRGRTTLGMEEMERAMAAKEGKAGEEADDCGLGSLGGDGGRRARSCVLDRVWMDCPEGASAQAAWMSWSLSVRRADGRERSRLSAHGSCGVSMSITISTAITPHTRVLPVHVTGQTHVLPKGESLSAIVWDDCLVDRTLSSLPFFNLAPHSDSSFPYHQPKP